MHRRKALQLIACQGAAVLSARQAHSAADVAALLRLGGCAVVLRHAQTVPGIGDPAGFRLEQCNTQRNLSDEGRAQAVRIGQWFKTRGLQPRSVQTSPWCRCKDTAELAFGKYTELAALGSTFDNRTSQDAQTKALRARLTYLPAGHFEIWVTHQVNVSALTNDAPAMGEAFIVNSSSKVLGRTTFSV